MNRRLVISKEKLWVFLITFFAFNLLFGSLQPTELQNFINTIGILLGCFIFLIDVPLFYRKSSVSFFVLIVLFSLFELYSTYVNLNNHTSINGLTAGISFLAKILAFFVLISYLIYNGYYKEVAKYLFFICLGYCIINDVMLIFRYGRFKALQVCLLGNKFEITYMHINLISFYLFQTYFNDQSKSIKTKLWVLFLYAILISRLVDCITGLNGVLFFVILFFLIPKKVIYNPILWITISVISFTSVYFWNQIVNSNLYQNLVIDWLSRDGTMMGRINIFKQLPQIMSGHWLWGYGAGSAYETINNYMNMPNAQNGFWNIILQIGSIAFIVLVIITVYSINKAKVLKIKCIEPLIIMIYVYSILAVFEITIDNNFIGYVLLIYLYTLPKILSREIK